MHGSDVPAVIALKITAEPRSAIESRNIHGEAGLPLGVGWGASMSVDCRRFRLVPKWRTDPTRESNPMARYARVVRPRTSLCTRVSFAAQRDRIWSATQPHSPDTACRACSAASNSPSSRRTSARISRSSSVSSVSRSARRWRFRLKPSSEAGVASAANRHSRAESFARHHANNRSDFSCACG